MFICWCTRAWWCACSWWSFFVALVVVGGVVVEYVLVVVGGVVFVYVVVYMVLGVVLVYMTMELQICSGSLLTLLIRRYLMTPCLSMRLKV